MNRNDDNVSVNPSKPIDRRDLLRRGVTMGAAGAALALGATPKVGAQSVDTPTPGDIAILRFLAAAELVEDDLWAQYCELAVNNPGYNRALTNIDPSLVRYICDDRRDELSHARLINAYLVSIGQQPVNLDPFRTLPGSRVVGSSRVGRLTNLSRLRVDTSWFNRYREEGNPDFGDSFPQLVNIVNRPTIPTVPNTNAAGMQVLAHTAAFHFCAIEQGGSSLYAHLVTRVVSRTAARILASIGPTEFYHFAVFQTSLEGLFGLNAGGGLLFPNLRGMPAIARSVMPAPCTFLDRRFPDCSIVRPTNANNAGAVAAATGLVNSGLFTGQSQAFFNAVSALATAADQANPGF